MNRVTLQRSATDSVELTPGAALTLEETSAYPLGVTPAPIEVRFGGVVVPPVDGTYQIATGHWVGEIELAVRFQDAVLRFPLNVEPNSDKLSAELWPKMVADLEAWLAGSTVGLEGGRSGRVGNDGAAAPLITEALLPLVPELLRRLGDVVAHARTIDGSLREDVPLRNVRKGSGEVVRWLARHPDVAQQVVGGGGDGDGEQPTLLYRRSIDRYDHPANRYVAWLVRRVAARLRATARRLDDIDQRQSNADTERQPRMAGDIRWCQERARALDGAAEQILRMLRHSFLATVSPQPADSAAMQLITDEPYYRRFHSLARLFLKPLFDPQSSQGPRAAVRPSYNLYELWCFLALARELHERFPDWQWSTAGTTRLLNPESTGEGVTVEARNAGGDRLGLELNASFNSYLAQGRKRYSISAARRPDIIAYASVNGARSWMCLDAKYRVGAQNLGKAFESAHIYHDALRYDEFGGRCRAAVLLCPAMTEETASWFAEDFREQHRVGAVQVRPGEHMQALGDLVSRILGLS